MKKTWAGLVVGVLVVAGAAYLLVPRLLSRPTVASDGGTRVTLEVDPPLEDLAAAKATEADAEVIERRLDGMGWHDISVRREGGRRLVVEVPKMYNREAVARLVSAPGALSFRLVRENPPADDKRLTPIDPSGEALAVTRQRIVEGNQVVYARPSVDPRTGAVVVNLRLNIAGTKAFAIATAANTGKQIAIVLDDKILMAPRVLAPITEGFVRISGNFTADQALDIAALMGSGSLPAPVTVKAAEHVAR